MGVSVSIGGAVVDGLAEEFVTGISISPHVVRRNKAKGGHTRNSRNITSVEFNDGDSCAAVVRFGKTV